MALYSLAKTFSPESGNVDTYMWLIQQKWVVIRRVCRKPGIFYVFRKKEYIFASGCYKKKINDLVGTRLI